MITELKITEFTPTKDKVIWDVRDAEQYQEGHIEHAVNHPLSTIDKTLLDATKVIFMSYVAAVLRHKSSKAHQ